MRDLNTKEVAHISGGLDHKDLAGLVGAYIGWGAGTSFYSYNFAKMDVGSFFAGLGGAMMGNVVARFTAGVMDHYVDPYIDQITS